MQWCVAGVITACCVCVAEVLAIHCSSVPATSLRFPGQRSFLSTTNVTSDDVCSRACARIYVDACTLVDAGLRRRVHRKTTARPPCKACVGALVGRPKFGCSTSTRGTWTRSTLLQCFVRRWCGAFFVAKSVWSVRRGVSCLDLDKG